MDSKLPYSRWSEGQGNYTMNAEGINREEIRYNKVIKRMRSSFKELITKPLYLQMCLDVKELKTDHKFSNAVGVNWYNDNVFEEIKNQELLNKRLATLNALKAVTKPDGTPYFSTDYLIKEYLKLSDEDIKKNKDYLSAETGGKLEPVEQKGKPAEPPPPPPPAKPAAAPSTPPTTPGKESGPSEAGAPGQT